MRTQRLANTELELTKIGLGTWAIGGSWQFGWGPQDDNDSVKTIHEALDEGINWIDTAPIYGCGHSEEVIGKALKQISQKPIIATKFSLLWDDQRRKYDCLKSQSVRDECHASLKRLGTDVIDLYQMHWPDPEQDIEEAWEEIARLTQQGKIRYAGVSNFNIEQIKKCHAIHPVSSLQPIYSMIKRGIENELLEFCAENNIGVIVYSPMAKGLLTGKFSSERLKTLAPDDHRLNDSNFKEPRLSENLKLVENLKNIAERNSKTVAQLAIAWTLRRKEVTAAIVGARKPGQIKQTSPAGDWQLTPEDIEQIEQLLAEL